jgi:O-antigen/teichoic acid export membrane protein
VLRQLLKSRFLRSAGTISGGAAVVQVIAFAASPVLTRLYGPEPFGVLGVLMAFVGFAATVASLHFEMAIALPKEDEKGAAVTLLSVTLAFVIAIVSIGIFSPRIFDFAGRLGFSSLVPYWWMLPICIFAVGLQQALTLWHLRRQRFADIGKNSILQSLSQNGLQIFFGILKFQSIGLLLGFVLSRIVTAVALVSRRLREDAEYFRRSVAEVRVLISEYRSFPTIGLLGAVMHVACFQLPVFILADLYGSKVTGWYVIQDRVLSVPLTILAQGVANVFYVDAAKLALSNPQGLRQSFFKVLRNLSFVGLVPTIVLLVAAPFLFELVFGTQWRAAGEYAQVMAVPTFVRFVAGPLFRCLTILKQQAWICIWDGVGLITLLMVVSAVATRNGPDSWAIYAVSAAITVTYAGLLGAATYFVIAHAKADRAREIKEVPAQAPSSA